MTVYFDHEKLEVYQYAIDFTEWVGTVLEKVPKGASARDQLDRASTSTPLNIAEGNGKYTSKDRCRFFDIARGSALECAAALDVLVARKFISKQEIEHGKRQLRSVVNMLVGLIKSNSKERLYEEHAAYGSDHTVA